MIEQTKQHYTRLSCNALLCSEGPNVGKASFTKGFAKEKIAEGRAPMVARLDTGDTIIEFETSFPKERAWKVYNLIAALADEDISPKDAFDNAFSETSA